MADQAGPRVTIVGPNYLQGMEPEAPPEKPKKKKKPTKAERRARRLKAQQEFKKLETRTHLRRELELSKKSAARGVAEWEDMCKEIKIVELREQLEYWAVKSTRLMQQKDEQILLCLKDMESTMEMHKRGYARHVQTMEYITDCFTALMECTRLLYEAQASEVIQDFQEELNGQKQLAERHQLNCENVMHATNLVVERQLLTDHQIFLETQDDRVNAEIEKRYRTRDATIAEMKTLHRQLQTFVASLRSASLDPHKYERIGMLMERQRNFVVESQKLNDIEFRSTRIYGDLQRDLLHLEMETQRRVNDLRLEQAYFVQVRKGIELEMRLDRENTFEKLRVLTSNTYKVLEKYKRMEKYGELLLSLAASCRKLQTEKEKVVSWSDLLGLEDGKADDDDPEPEPEDSEFEKAHFKLQTLDMAKHLDLTEEELAEQSKLLRNFWRRQAMVEMQNMLLLAEKRRLTAENEKYCNYIRSLSKTDRVDELLEAIHVDSVLPVEPPCTPLGKKPKKPQP